MCAGRGMMALMGWRDGVGTGFERVGGTSSLSVNVCVATTDTILVCVCAFLHMWICWNGQNCNCPNSLSAHSVPATPSQSDWLK